MTKSENKELKEEISISILIPTYNRPKFFSLCLESCLEQKGFNDNRIEYIITDDSNNNDTLDYIQNIQKTHKDKNIHYIKNDERLGMVGNWNKLLTLAKGQYYIFLSDDDLFYSETSLSELYSGAIEHSKNAVFGLRKIIDENGKITSSFHRQEGENQIFDIGFKKILGSNQGGFGGILFKNFGEDFFDENVGMATDWDFNISYLKKHGSFSSLNTFTFQYRVHSGRLSEAVNLMQESEKKVVLKWSGSYMNYVAFKIKKRIFQKIVPIFVNICIKIGIYNFIRKKI